MVRTAAAMVAAVFVLAAGDARSAEPVDEVRAALDDLNQWLNAVPTGPGWQKFLHLDELEAQLAEPEKVAPGVLADLIRPYAKGKPETDRDKFVRLRKALDAWLDSLPMTAEQLQAEIEKAKQSFSPLTESDVAAAKARLIEALKKLGAALDPANEESSRWREYLQWDRLEEQLAREEGPDLATLDEIYAKYAAGYEGLDLAVFDDVRAALRGYLNTARAAAAPAVIKAQYEQLLDALPEYLERHRKNPTPDDAAALASAIEWLEDAGQASWLVESIRRDFTHPNLFGRIDADVVKGGLEGPVDETGPVTDVILGASVRGTGHTVGRIEGELVPNDLRAEIVTVFKGTINSTTRSYKDGATVSSTGVTQIETRKPLVFTAEGFAALPATSKATTQSTIRGINSGRGAAGQQAATRQVYGQKSQAERISSQHAEDRANRRADEKAAEMLAEPQKSYLEKFRHPLEQRKLFPRQLDFRTTSQAVLLTGLQAGPYDLGAPGAPPATIDNPHMAVQVHESAFNNYAAGSLSGRILTEAQFLATLEQLLGEVPERLKNEEEHEPWTITFSRSQPITVTFGDGQFRMTIRGRHFVSGGKDYPDDMDITAVYKVVKGDDGFKAVRQGDLEIFPPGFTPGGDAKLSVPKQTIRRMLERRFEKMFDKEIVPEPLVLPGEWEKTGKYKLDQWDVADGWMVMAWNRIPGSETAAPAEQKGQ
jgi:hypothetical protein